MPTIPLHPALVHVPLGLALVVPLIALATAVACWRGGATRRTFGALLLLQAALVAGAVAALRTGHGEEDRVERIVSKQVLEAHEERAEVFVWASAVVLAVAAASLVVPQRGLRAVAAAAAAGSIVVAALGVRTGRAGGELVYAHGAAAAYANAGTASTAPAPARERGHGDDD